MGNYTARALVRIKDKTKRMDIYERASSGRIRGVLRHEKDEYIAFDDTVIAIRDEELADYFLKVGFINCNHFANGDEELAVKLFLELAEMDSDNADTMWYFAETLTTDKEGGDVRSDTVYFKGLSLFAKCNPTTQPLTPLKLAKAVRDGKIKL